MSSAPALGEMLKLVEQHRLRRCREVLADAQVQAQALLRDAQHTARARMHAHIQMLKQERRQALALAAAELETTRRQYHNRCDYALIEAGMCQLEAALLARWQDGTGRRDWIEGLVQNALTRLPRESWKICHAPRWPQNEQRELGARLAPLLAGEPTFQAEAGIRAGLRVQSGTALLDGTLEGVLADRGAIEAQLLAELSDQVRSP
jgi:hypothetical protein